MTALVVRDLLGGEILLADVLHARERVERHAWNRLASGVEVDLTASQFRRGETLGPAASGEPLVRTICGPRAALFAGRVAEHLAR